MPGCRLALVLIAALTATSVALAPSLLSLLPDSLSTDVAYGQAVCDFPGLPLGQSDPPGEPESSSAIWCSSLVPGPTTFVSGANDWIDAFRTGVHMQQFGPVQPSQGNSHQDEAIANGYKFFNNFTTGGSGGTLKSQGFINNNHWMFDLAGRSIEGGTLLSPNRSFRWENGKLVVEADVAAGIEDYSGADHFVELDINTSPTITHGKRPESLGIDCGRNIERYGQYAGTCKTPDNLYGYGAFPGHWSLGCRIESTGNIICSLYNPNGESVTSGNHPTGMGRVWEISPIETGTDIQTLYTVPGILGNQQLFRHCRGNPNSNPDMFCRDRFRLELTATTLTLFVNGGMYFSFGVMPGHSVPGVPDAGQLVPNALVNGANYAYYTTWISAFNTAQSVRFHWQRVAVNPHNPDGSPMPPSPAPSYCPGEPMNTCQMVGMPTQTPTPTVAATATRTPAPTATWTATPLATATATLLPSQTLTPSPTSPPAASQSSSPPASSESSRGGGSSSSRSSSPSSSNSSRSSAPAAAAAEFGGGGGGGGGAGASPRFATLPIVSDPVPPTPTAVPEVLEGAASASPRLQVTIPAGGAVVTADRLTLVVPSGAVGESGASMVVTRVGPSDQVPPVSSGLQIGDVSVRLSITDAATGEPIVTLAPPMNATYAPSDAELERVGGDLGRITLVAANDTGWEPLTCSPTGATLTCSVPRAGILASMSAAVDSGALDFDVPNGHFYKQHNGFGGGATIGFTVIDDMSAAFWSEFQRLGGVDQLGYPISRRFMYRGSITQVFQRGVLQWEPDPARARLLNTLDELSAAGSDGWLDAHLQIPAAADWSADRDLATEEATSRHLSLLDGYPDLKDALAATGAVDQYGLPTALKQYGSTIVVRFQRATMQRWLDDTSLAPAGTTVVASGSQLGKQVGLWPSDAMTPEPTPPTAFSP